MVYFYNRQLQLEEKIKGIHSNNRFYIITYYITGVAMHSQDVLV